MSDSTFSIERIGRTAVITFDNSPANVFTARGLSEMARLLDTLKADREIDALVITGAGDRFFSAGDDLNMYVGASPAEARERTRLLAAVISRLDGFTGLTVAAINGWCVGAGLECALACDIRIGENHARFGLPEARVGLLPCGGGTQRLAWQVGEGWAKRMILCGETVDAETALRIGLVEECVDAGGACDQALALTEQARRQSAPARKASKALIRAARSEALESALMREREAYGGLFEGPDPAEGVAAFLDKREPSWRGSS